VDVSVSPVDKTCVVCGNRARFGRYCSRECLARHFEPANIPPLPADVVHHDGPSWRWTCRGCGRLAVGNPPRADGNRWYCKHC
jgi:hypothetical protein